MYNNKNIERVYNALVTYKTFGKRKTDFENYTLKNLFDMFLIARKKPKKMNNLIVIAKLVHEIEYRVVCSVPPVKVGIINMGSKIINASVDTNCDPKLDENKKLTINITALEKLNVSTLLHEFRHLYQQYNLSKLRAGETLSNYDTACSMYMLFSHMFSSDGISYQYKLEEFDANYYAYKTKKMFYKNNILSQSKENDYHDALVLYNILYNFDYNKSRVKCASLEFCKKKFKYYKNLLLYKLDFVDDSIKDAVKSVDIDKFFKDVTSHMAELEEDFKTIIINRFPEKYNDFFSNMGEIKHNPFNLMFLAGEQNLLQNNKDIEKEM